MNGRKRIIAAVLFVLLGLTTSRVTAIEHKVDICHKGKNTINVDLHAVPAHLAHGDTVGPCGGAPPI